MNPRAQNFFFHNCYYHFIKFERIEEETKVLNFFSFFVSFRFVSSSGLKKNIRQKIKGNRGGRETAREYVV